MKSYIHRCVVCEDDTVLTAHKHVVMTGMGPIQAFVRKCVNPRCGTYWALYTHPLPNNSSKEMQKRIDKP